MLLLTGGDGLQEAFASFSLYLGRGSIDDANDESDDAEHDGERSEAFSAFVSGKGEKQQYGNERDKDHCTRSIQRLKYCSDQLSRLSARRLGLGASDFNLHFLRRALLGHRYLEL